MDIFTIQKRSEIMSRIRSVGSQPEGRLFDLTKSILGRTRILRNAREVTGTPDLFIPSLSLALFLDGCFFHGCPTHGHIPKSNVDYWSSKIARNMSRDRRYRAALRSQGVSVWRFWEHELKGRALPKTLVRLALAIERARYRGDN
jgi:DNA mismatch endonuclease (patch repair protein)